MSTEPVYIESCRNGTLKKNAALLRVKLSNCDLCPRKCNINRLEDEKGICNTGAKAMVSSYSPHFGEERVLVGRNGSGTIFFTHCNLLCKFCQNYEISHQGQGKEVDDEQLSEFMLYLQDNGCHNINFVTPSHVIPQIISALEIAVPKGLEIPIIYNSSGYDSLESLKLLEGLIDIYMPDFKFWNPDIAKRTCETPDYPSVARRAIMEMYRQVGDLLIGENGIAKRGLLVRHLVMPENYSGTEDIMKFIADKVSVNTYVNIMSQYRPSGMAHSVTEINRKIKDAEFTEALNAATNNGITLIDC